MLINLIWNKWKCQNVFKELFIKLCTYSYILFFIYVKGKILKNYSITGQDKSLSDKFYITGNNF